MVGLWEIVIGKGKPTGDPVQPTATEPKRDRIDDDGTPESETDASKKKQEGEIDEQDTKEYVEYASVEGVQVMLSKRTKYRVWKEFENGTHSTFIFASSHCTNDWFFCRRYMRPTWILGRCCSLHQHLGTAGSTLRRECVPFRLIRLPYGQNGYYYPNTRCSKSWFLLQCLFEEAKAATRYS